MKKFVIIVFALGLIACGKEKLPEQKIAGDTHKEWHAKKQLSSAGKKEKLTSEEKQDVVRFYANGKFSMNSETTTSSGTWDYNQATNSLSLVFDGQNVSENFKVLELTDDRMRLEAGDGSEMVLDAE